MPEIPIPEAHHETLESTTIALMSTIRHKDGLISTNPVGFVWDGESIRISTTKDRVKYRNLVANPNITFCAVDPVNPMKYVEIRGTASLTDDTDKSFLETTFTSAGMEMPDDLEPPETERVVIRIHPEQCSSPVLYGGRFDRD